MNEFEIRGKTLIINPPAYNGGWITMSWAKRGKLGKKGWATASVRIHRGGLQEIQDWLAIHADEFRQIADVCDNPKDFVEYCDGDVNAAGQN